MLEYADETLIEMSNVTDIYADGLHRIELLGDNIRIVYFRWKIGEDGSRWQKVASDYAFVIPKSALKRPLREWAPVTVIQVPAFRATTLN